MLAIIVRMMHAKDTCYTAYGQGSNAGSAACALPEQCAGRTLKGAVHHGPRPALAQSLCQILTALHHKKENLTCVRGLPQQCLAAAW